MSSLPLTRPIKPYDRTAVHTIDEACAYLIALPGRIATLPAWECVADLALKAREKPTEASLEAFTRQFELALFLAHRLDLAADRGALDRLLDHAHELPKERPR